MGVVFITFSSLVAALVAFFLAARVVTLDRRALRTHRVSWMLLLLVTALYAAVLAVELVTAHVSGAAVIDWVTAGLEAALAVALVVCCFFLYVREHERVAALVETAETETRRSRRLEAIIKLGGELRAAQSSDEVARVAASAVERTLAFRENALYLRDAAEDVYYTAACCGSYPDYEAEVRDKRIPGRVIRGLLRPEFARGRCCFIDHRIYTTTDEEKFFFPNGPMGDGPEGGFHADDALFVPLYDRDDELIGLFDVYDPMDGLIPSEDTFQLLEVFATVTASAIENVHYAAELRRRAVTDGLTGLYNHRQFHETLEAEVERARRYETVFTLLMMDLDLFKDVNDRFGHPRGDEALQAVAAVLRANARASDFVARYGGEEFVMILPGTSMGQAHALAERVAQGVRGVTLDVPDPPRMSASIGMADFPACGRDRESLIAAADAALLFAKRSGRDMVADFSQVSLVELDGEALEGLAFRLEKADIETVETLAAAIEMRDAFAGQRTANVAKSAAHLAGALGLDANQTNVLRMAALVYDIGKVGIPVEVLNRRGALTEEEMLAVRRHPEMGMRLLQSTMRLNGLLPVVLHHHERWDGMGYPDGLQGEQIPFAARVIALCDAWEAMVSERPYRPALSHDEAVEELRRGTGTQFDPALVEVFISSLALTGGAVG